MPSAGNTDPAPAPPPSEPVPSSGDRPVYLVDRCLGGEVVPRLLRAAGHTVVAHHERFAHDALDEVWIAEVAELGWIVLTKDRHILRHGAEIAALRRTRGALILTNRRQVTGEANADALIRALRRFEPMLRSHTRPLICTVDGTGKLTIQEGQRRGGVRRRRDDNAP